LWFLLLSPVLKGFELQLVEFYLLGDQKKSVISSVLKMVLDSMNLDVAKCRWTVAWHDTESFRRILSCKPCNADHNVYGPLYRPWRRRGTYETSPGSEVENNK